jgi:hypothetical protein
MSTHPLSEAQIDQRRQAARDRWAAVRAGAAGVAGGAAAAYGATRLTNTIERQRRQRLRDAFAPVMAADKTRWAAHDIDKTTLAGKLARLRTHKDLMENAPPIFAEMRDNAEDKAARAAERASVRPFIQTEDGSFVEGPADPLAAAEAMRHMDESDRWQSVLDDLKANGRMPRRVHVRRHRRGVQQDMFHRRQQRVDVQWHPKTFDAFLKVRNDIAAGRRPNSVMARFTTLEEMGQALVGKGSKKLTEALRSELGHEPATVIRRERVQRVRNAARTVGEHQRRLEGFPDPKTRRKLLDEAKAHVEREARMQEGERSLKHMFRLQDLRGDAKAKAAKPLRDLRILRRGKYPLIGASLLAGAFAAAAAERKLESHFAPKRQKNVSSSLAKFVHRAAIRAPILLPRRQPTGMLASERTANHAPNYSSDYFQALPGRADHPLPAAGSAGLGLWTGAPVQPQTVPRLAKADRPQAAPGGEQRRAGAAILAAAEGIEGRLARGVGSAFRDWKDRAEKLTDAHSITGPGGLIDQLDAPMAQGMAPLDEAVKGGMDAPTKLTTGAGDGHDPKTISFSMLMRSKNADDFLKHYRMERVREITEAQRQELRRIVAEGATFSHGPDVLARKIRDVIGLTRNQAQTVRNFRTLLETLDPRALTYELRDKRFDKTVRRAIDDRSPIDPRMIDKMVDAYHRRMLAYRATTIARTESLRAANNGQMAAVETFLHDNPGFTVVKTWIATDDDRTRPDHRELDKKTVVGLSTPFRAESGDELLWPHDPHGPARQVINCRCSLMTRLVPQAYANSTSLDRLGKPYENFWTGPRPPFDMEGPRAPA